MNRMRRPPVIAGIASIPSRSQSLRQVLESIGRQVDRVEVVLNGYEAVPEWLRDERIGVTVSQEVGDHADNAKFLGLGKYDDCVYFAIDDDILYPPDYVARMLACLSRYGGRAAVGVHGSFVPERPGTFLHRRVSCFWDAAPFDAPCSYAGTGTIAMTREMMPAAPLSLFTDTGMSDLFVASSLKLRRIPVICIERPLGWLRKIPNPGPPSLWQRAQTDSVRQDGLLGQVAPWGVVDLLDRCRGAVLERLAPEVRVALDAADRIVRGADMPDSLREALARHWDAIRGMVRHYAGPDADRPPAAAP